MGRKAEERERRREKNKKVLKYLWCAFGVALFFDLLVLFIAVLSYDAEVVKYSFFAAIIIAAPTTWLAAENMDGPSFWPFF